MADSVTELDYLVVETRADSFQQLREEMQKQREEHAFQLAAIKDQLNLLTHTKKNTLESNNLITFLFWMFFIGQTLCCCGIFVQMILLFTSYSAVVSSVAFFIVNIFGTGWSCFSLGFALCHAPSLTSLRLYELIYVLNLVCGGVWSYFVFGLIEAICFAVSAMIGVSTLFLTRPTYLAFTILPLNDNFLELWMNCWRLFLIVATPIIARVVQEGKASQVSYFLVVLFCLAMSIFCISCRILFAIYPAASVASLFMKARVFPLMLNFGPVLGLFIVFAVFYIIEVSGSSFVVADSVVISLLAFAMLFMTIWSNVSFSVVVKWKFLQIFYPYNSFEDKLLVLAQTKGLEQLQLPIVF